MEEIQENDQNSDHAETRGPRVGVTLSVDQASLILSRHLGTGITCKSLRYVKRGFNNRTYIATSSHCNNDEEFVIRLSGKIWTRMKTESEVATILYVQSRDKGGHSKVVVPLPEIVGYCSDRDKSGVGQEYILMKRLVGKPLDEIWESLDKEGKKKVVAQVSGILKVFQGITFDKIGSLQFTEEIGNQLGLGISLKEINPRRDIIVGKGLEAEAGPFETYLDYLTSALKTEMSWLEKCEFMLEGNEGQEILQRVRKFIEEIESNSSSIFPEETQNVPFVLTHGDFEPRNILVNEDTLDITGILDFEFAGAFPIDEDWFTGFSDFGASSSVEEAFNEESSEEDDNNKDSKEIKDYFLDQCKSRGAFVPENIPGHSSRVLLYYLRVNICPWFLREAIDPIPPDWFEERSKARQRVKHVLSIYNY